MAIKFVFVDGDGRRSKYIGVFGWRYSLRKGSEALKSEDLKGTGESGVRASPVIVMGRAKREELEVKSLNVAWRSEDAVIPDCIVAAG